jgi:glutathione-regulated potassium-efflux system ancillary protein KefF
MAEILVLAAHPRMRQSRITRRLLAAARRAAAALSAQQQPAALAGAPHELAGAPRIEVRDLYALYPDYCIDLAAEQNALKEARLIVWLHPIHWYSMPPLMKLWVDEVLTFGWAYGPRGQALQGKDLWLVCSTGGTEEAYRPGGQHQYAFDTFMHPYAQTAALCGMRFLAPPLVLHGAHQRSEAEVQAHEDLFAKRLLGDPAWRASNELHQGAEGRVAANERPDPLLDSF